MNSVNLVGRITKALELKTTASNIPVVTFTLAVNRQFTNESGEREADFIQCVIWRKQAENLAQYCDKGSLVGLSGRLQTRQYDTDNGTKYITEVVVDNVEFLDTKKHEETTEEDRETYEQVQRLGDSVGNGKNKQDKHNEKMYEVSKALAAEEDLPF